MRRNGRDAQKRPFPRMRLASEFGPSRDGAAIRELLSGVPGLESLAHRDAGFVKIAERLVAF
jgi:hypothetical protein